MSQTKNWSEAKINLQHNNQKLTNYWLIIVSILVISLTIFSICVPYKDYKKYSGIVKVGEKVHVQIYMDDHTIMELPNLHISRNKKQQKWNLKSVSEEYYLDEKMNKYHIVALEMELEPEIQIENNLVELLIEYPPETLWNRIKKSFKGGYKE